VQKPRKNYTPEEQGRDPQKAPDRKGPRCRPVRAPADSLLQLAETDLRERHRRVPTQRQTRRGRVSDGELPRTKCSTLSARSKVWTGCRSCQTPIGPRQKQGGPSCGSAPDRNARGLACLPEAARCCRWRIRRIGLTCRTTGSAISAVNAVTVATFGAPHATCRITTARAIGFVR